MSPRVAARARGRSATYRQQRGIALLTAIVLFAIATVLAAAITYNKAMAARRAAATFALDQALQAGLAAESLAALALETSLKDNASETLPSGQVWTRPFGPVEIEDTGIWIAGQLEDLQGRFNLNSLVVFDQAANAFVADPGVVKEFQQLLQQLDLEPKWADLLVDWLDSDIAASASGGEDALYLAQTPAYRPPNTFITSTSELLALPGFGAERYKRLAPYVLSLIHI